jgi:hypothetical protein
MTARYQLAIASLIDVVRQRVSHVCLARSDKDASDFGVPDRAAALAGMLILHSLSLI